MMGEIIDDGHTIDFTTHLATTAYTLESCQSFGNFFSIDSPRVSGNDCRQTIAHVEVANQRCLKFLPLRAVAKHCEVCHVASEADIARLPLSIVASPKGFQTRKQLVSE